MLKNTRRRALGLLAAALGAPLLPPLPRALARTDCFAQKAFGPWKAQATDSQAGASMTEVKFVDPCDLRVDVRIAASFDGKLVVYGDPDKTKLPKKFLIKPENRLIARDEDGKVVVDEPLCGTCTDIFDNKVSLIMPLATAPLFRDGKSVEIGIKLADKDECRFKLDCEILRKALGWASTKQLELAQKYAEEKCTPPEGDCFITTACCDVLGLADDCFELRTLRRYRDEVLVRRPGGAADIALYYAIAPEILARLTDETRGQRLRSVYAVYILPSAIAAKLGLNALAYRLYARMLRHLAVRVVPEIIERLPSH